MSTDIHRRWTRVLTNSDDDHEAGRNLVGCIGVSDATIAEFDRGVVHGRQVEADGFCVNDCPGHH